MERGSANAIQNGSLAMSLTLQSTVVLGAATRLAQRMERISFGFMCAR